MNLDISALKQITKYKIIYPILLLGIINLGLIIGVFFIGNTLYQKYLSLQTEKDKISQLKSRVVLVRNNKDVFDGRIDEYNEILGKLIPDEESYFSVITALDSLASRTGVTITSYSINLKSTTEEKLTLSLVIDGDQEALNKLLADYMFTSGRLITNEESTIVVDKEEQSLSISFNFLHKKFNNAVISSVVVTKKDIQFLDEVKLKM
jgi:hypothetical protein